jgi:hypothetical protein
MLPCLENHSDPLTMSVAVTAAAGFEVTMVMGDCQHSRLSLVLGLAGPLGAEELQVRAWPPAAPGCPLNITLPSGGPFANTGLRAEADGEKRPGEGC